MQSIFIYSVRKKNERSVCFVEMKQISAKSCIACYKMSDCLQFHETNIVDALHCGDVLSPQTFRHFSLSSHRNCKKIFTLRCWSRSIFMQYTLNFWKIWLLNHRHDHGCIFVVKCGGTAWRRTNVFIELMWKWSFVNTDSQSSFLEVFSKRH